MPKKTASAMCTALQCAMLAWQEECSRSSDHQQHQHHCPEPPLCTAIVEVPEEAADFLTSDEMSVRQHVRRQLKESEE